MLSTIIVKLENLKNMKKITAFFISSLLFLSCAKDDVNKPDKWPEWPTPSKPKIENAALRGVNGETIVAAGDKVKFTAEISDEYNDLVSFQLLVTMDGAEILNLSKKLSGRAAHVEEEVILPFVAGFRNGRPVVTIKAVNDLGGNESELTLDESASVEVTRPETPFLLYLIDNLGHVYEMDKAKHDDSDYGFRTTATDLAEIGGSFKLAEKVVNNKPDYTGLVWGYSDGKIAIVTEESAASIPTPKVDNYILENITFDMLSFLTDKTLVYTIDIDKSRFFDVGGGYIQLDVELVESAKINFIGFGSDVTGMLRPEFFKDISGTRAKFDGPSVLYNLKYNTSNGFLYMERPRDIFYPEVMYIVGTGVGFPSEPYVATLAWDFTYPHQWYFFKKVGASVFEAVVYIDQTMGFKFFRGYGWAQEEDTKDRYIVEPADLVTRSTPGDLIPGPEFTPGLYTIRIDKAVEKIELIPFLSRK